MPSSPVLLSAGHLSRRFLPFLGKVEVFFCLLNRSSFLIERCASLLVSFSGIECPCGSWRSSIHRRMTAGLLRRKPSGSSRSLAQQAVQPDRARPVNGRVRHFRMAQLHKSKATLRIAGDALVPDLVTASLGCAPDKAQVKGQEFVGRTTGHVRVAKFGMWRLAAPEASPGDLDAQIKSILAKLRPIRLAGACCRVRYGYVLRALYAE